MSDMTKLQYMKLFFEMDENEFALAHSAMIYYVTDKMCTKMLIFLYTSIKETVRLQSFFENGTLSFEDSNNNNIYEFFQMTISDGKDKKVVLSIMVSYGRCGNIAEDGDTYFNNHTKLTGNPKTIDILIVSADVDIEKSLEYNGDIKTFYRNDSIDENGFNVLIDEIIRIHNIVNNVSDLNSSSSI